MWEIKCFHALGTLSSERIKVAARNLFHPTASAPPPKAGFFHIATQSLEGEGIIGEISNIFG
jgi:hypothetical protein